MSTTPQSEKVGDPPKNDDVVPETPEKEINAANSQSSGNSEGTCRKDPEIVPFSPDSKMLWIPWLRYFESVCVEEHKDDLWKIRNIQKYLKDTALTLYINNCLHVLHWSELVLLFTEHYTTPDTLSLTDFSQIKFKFGGDLNEYYHQKTKVGRTLGLDQRFILDGLTDGLPVEMKQLVVTNAPADVNEWRELVFKLSKLQLEQKDKTDRKTEPNPQHPPQYRQWKPFKSHIDHGQNSYRPWNYRVPNQSPQFRHFNPNPQRNTFRPMQPTPSRSMQTDQQRPNLHYQATLPPTPCRVCLNVGISNAYHWVRDCPFRKQTLNVTALAPNPNVSTHNLDQTNNEFPQNTEESQ